MAQTNLSYSSSPSSPVVSPSPLGKLLSAVRADPKKAGVLLVLTAVLAFMVVRAAGPGSPRRAQAAPTLRSASAGIRGGTGTTRGSGNASDPRQAARDQASGAYLRKWSENPVAPLSRNLFAVRLEYFPVENARTNPAGAKGREDDGFWARLEKSLALQADQRDKRENQKANYTARAAQLKLQSTMMGPQPKALVNGELVGEGDVIADFFRVEKIEARRMIIEREGIRLEIQMK